MKTLGQERTAAVFFTPTHTPALLWALGHTCAHPRVPAHPNSRPSSTGRCSAHLRFLLFWVLTPISCLLSGANKKFLPEQLIICIHLCVVGFTLTVEQTHVCLKKKKGRQKVYSKKERAITAQEMKIDFSLSVRTPTHTHRLYNCVLSAFSGSLCERLLCPDFTFPSLHRGFLKSSLLTPFLQRNCYTTS